MKFIKELWPDATKFNEKASLQKLEENVYG
jgi:hypothetical protein